MKQNILFAVFIAFFASCSSSPKNDSSANIDEALTKAAADKNDTSPNTATDAPTTPVSSSPKKWIKILRIGKGPKIKNGQLATVHYIGRLLNGKKFDSSRDRKKPFSFHVGAREVIQGWDIGVEGMRVGERRKLTVPPELGYGAQSVGNGLIPPNSTLVFDVELLKIN